MTRFLLTYLPSIGNRDLELRSALDKALCNLSFAVYRDIESLKRELVQNLSTPDFILLVIPNRQELMDIATLHHLIQKSGLILILPDQDPALLEIAHTLRPRFVGYADDDFTVIAEVLVKLIEGLEQKQKAGGEASSSVPGSTNRLQTDSTAVFHVR